MRVYVYCKNCGEKIYLDDIRDRRSHYPPVTTISCSSCDYTGSYSQSEIEAEVDGNSTAAGAIAGGVAGALAGPIGVAVGAGIGSMLGNNADQEDRKRVERFYDDQPPTR